jgi:hypothetical protein
MLVNTFCQFWEHHRFTEEGNVIRKRRFRRNKLKRVIVVGTYADSGRFVTFLDSSDTGISGSDPEWCMRFYVFVP